MTKQIFKLRHMEHKNERSKQTISIRFVLLFRDLEIMKIIHSYHLEIKASNRFNLSLK